MRIPAAARAIVLGGLLTFGVAMPPVAFAEAGPWANFQANAQHTGLATNKGPRSINSAWAAYFPDNVDSGVAIATDGTIFSVATDGTMQALAPDGGQKWLIRFGARVYATPVIGQDGKVLLGDVRGRFRAIAPDTGTYAWSITGLPSVRGTAAVAPDGSIYFGTDNGQLISLDVNGKERFRVTATSRAAITAAPAIAPNGDVFWAAQDGNLKHMSNTGNISWDLPVGGTIVSAPAIGPDGTVYAGAGSNLVAVDSSGAIKWQLGLGG